MVWFLLLSVLVFNTVFLFMPKKIEPIEIFTTCMFALICHDNLDIYLDVKLNLYGYFSKGVQWATLLPVFGIYPAINTIFLNYYPLTRAFIKRFYYILGWTVFALAYEWLADLSGFFYHNQWKLWCSAICYPFIFILLVFVLKFVRKLNHAT